MATSLQSIEVNEFVCRFRDLIENSNAKFCFFLGAGCSATSGIPTVGTLVNDIWLPKLRELKIKNQENFDDWFKKRFPEYDKDNAAQYYGEMMESLFPTLKQRQQEIERLVEKGRPGFGYTVLAQLLSEKFRESCNKILTTNFDDMVADALYLYTSKKPVVILHESLASFVKISDKRPLVIKMHGDSKFSPQNTNEETSELPKELKEVLKKLFSETGLIFIGYGGNDPSIIKILNEASKSVS